jgi:8-oxo-dGTP pyrophosphatase MutT (NUDIX family)
MSDFPRQWTVSALILMAGRRILLIHHRRLGVWLYPGGHVEPDETPDEALVREVWEETRLQPAFVQPGDPRLADAGAEVYVLAQPYAVLCERIPDPSGPHDHVDLIYACVVDAAALGREHEEELRSITREEAGELAMFPNFRELLEKAFDDEELWRSAERVRDHHFRAAAETVEEPGRR